MGVSAFNENRTFYDPFYRPDVGGSRASTRSRKWFDDFSVSEHLHILKPQSVSMNTTSAIQDSVRGQSRKSAILSKSQTLPRPSMTNMSTVQSLTLCRCASGTLPAPKSEEATEIACNDERA